MKTLSIILALLSVPALSGCCKPNQPPSFFCKLQERAVDCAREIGTGASAELAAKILAIVRGGGDWEGALQSLVDVSGDAAVCVIGNLPEIFAKKPAAGREEFARRLDDLKKTEAFMKRRGLTVRK